MWFRAVLLKIMFYVYILHSLKDHKLYIGYSADLKQRIIAHNKGKVESTKSRRPNATGVFKMISSYSPSKAFFCLTLSFLIFNDHFFAPPLSASPSTYPRI